MGSKWHCNSGRKDIHASKLIHSLSEPFRNVGLFAKMSSVGTLDRGICKKRRQRLIGFHARSTAQTLFAPGLRRDLGDLVVGHVRLAWEHVPQKMHGSWPRRRQISTSV